MRHPLLKIMRSNVLASLALAFATALPSSALAQGSLEFGPVVSQQAPAVVTIFENGGEVDSVPKTSAPDGDQTVDDGEEDRVLGSGFLISPEGYIVPSNDMIENAEDLQVGLANSDEPAKLVGRDSQSGIASSRSTSAPACLPSHGVIQTRSKSGIRLCRSAKVCALEQPQPWALSRVDPSALIATS